MSAYSGFYNGSMIEDFFAEESSTILPGPTVVSVPTDNSTAVTWGSVAGVVAFLMAVSGALVAARRKLQAVDRVLSRVQSGLATILSLFVRRQGGQDATTSPMGTPGPASGVPFRNATDSDRQHIEMRGRSGHCEQGARSLWV